jgi:glutamate formiminotransferase
LVEKMRDSRWAPDFGPPAPHPSAGASVIGAREFLIAFNVNLGTADIQIADRIARAVRHVSGGLRYCKAMGVALKDRGQVQVSINMVNYRKTPLHRVVEMIRSEAERYGVPVVGSEIVGLVPNDAMLAAADFYLRLERFDTSQVLENRLAAPSD